MSYFEDLYSKKDRERKEQEIIQEQEVVKRMLQRYNDDVKYINKLIKAIIEKLSYEPPDKCDWICANENEREKELVAWRMYDYKDYDGCEVFQIYLLPNGKLTYRYADDAKYLEYVNYVEGLSFEEWRRDPAKLPFYRGIITVEEYSWYRKGDYPRESDRDFLLLRYQFTESAKSIFGVEIDEN